MHAANGAGGAGEGGRCALLPAAGGVGPLFSAWPQHPTCACDAVRPLPPSLDRVSSALLRLLMLLSLLSLLPLPLLLLLLLLLVFLPAARV